MNISTEHSIDGVAGIAHDDATTSFGALDAAATATDRSRGRKTLIILFHVACIVTAMLVLGLLLMLSTSGQPRAYRQLDATFAHLSELTDAADQGVALAVQPEVLSIDLSPLASLTIEAVERLGSGLKSIYRSKDELEGARKLASSLFNAIDDQPAPSADVVMEGYGSFKANVQIFATTLSAFSDNRDRYAALRTSLDADSRVLVQNLRERGKNAAADEVYRGTRQLLRRSEISGEASSLETIVDRLMRPIAGVTATDRSRLNDLLAQAEELAQLQAQMMQQLALMNVSSVRSHLAELRDRTTVDHLYVLNTMSGARVLLNIYTVLLLCVLGYFGLRLNRSYAALNRSHDDLELRVHERTSDLEEALVNLKESQVQLVQAEKMSSLGQLVAGVMHEINTPLLYVLNNTQVSAELVGELKEYVDRSAPIVKAAGGDKSVNVDALLEDIEEVQTLATDSTEGLHTISELVQSLKDFSRIDRVAEDRFDVREGLEKTLIITKNLLKYGIEVEREFNEVPDIFCSPSRLNQVFTNLITNAAQAMDGKGKLKISTHSTDDWVEIVFQDTGCGIPEEHLTKIMDPFFTTKPVGQGTGLGLSIVRTIVEEHEGQIYIDSKPDRGTRITLGFPVHREEKNKSATSDIQNSTGEAA